MFSKLLIANRGEIACRVIRTARRMGIRTVAVYSEADARALHVETADEAQLIGPARARDSYLRIDRIIEAARRSGAEAVHPGYGFLSENAEFAEACAKAGLVFVGPPPAAIRAMGSKSAAKALMEKAGVPLVPGYHGEAQEPKLLLKEAKRIGFPVLIKASAGGGGKGMRIVESETGFAEALASAQREAAAAFGDDRVLIEKYLQRPRHIEVQVFADTHGNCVHLFERDCSVQRRHQKVVEEAPAPGMTASRRREIGATAIAAAQAVAYVGAGTVELIAEGDAFYFMEMNTRLQVEHPVTEMITGQDLVEWQLRVAAGQPLPLTQDQLAINGHAIEVRVYAEDPARGFLPSTGRLRHVRPPATGAHVRVDTGVRAGDEVTVHYDPMIAKLIAWDETREAALRRLRGALDDYEVIGPTTNIAFLRRVAGHAEFIVGSVDTGFIARNGETLLATASPPLDRVLAAATLAVLLGQQEEAAVAARASADPFSPWHAQDGWRLDGETYRDLQFRLGEAEHTVRVRYRGASFLLDLPGGALAARAERLDGAALALDLAGQRSRVVVVRAADENTVLVDGAPVRLTLVDPLAPRVGGDESGGKLTAPMPGKVIQVLAEAGATVVRGQALMVLEAMKMEHTIAAPIDGVLARVNYRIGDLVEEGAELIAFAEGESDAAPA
jgi:3-methylcrotonyl-CoA carboxylase alpha subunit